MFTSALRTLFLAALLALPMAAANDVRQNNDSDVPQRHNEATVAQLQSEMASGELTSEELTKEYIARIIALDQNGPGVNAIIELNPDALDIARNADRLRRSGIVLGPLHGIPVLLKDNVDTGDMMQTTAGSFALLGKPAVRDSTVAANLRAGGAVILGKTNLSEWANFRSFESISGWSGRGGQTNNPYGISRNPCGSSSGSGAATSANFAAVSFGTETDGSIVCPANANGVVGIKPTVGLTSRAGIVPISHTQVPTAAPWPMQRWRWGWCRAAPMTAAIRPPAAFPWDGKAGSRARRTSPPTTPNSSTRTGCKARFSA
jgi:amidase